jgi:quercetin dioxygenase-like cupin family protein
VDSLGHAECDAARDRPGRLSGPVHTLKPGEVFYEPPNALHAISRNASMAQPLRYLVIQVSDPAKPATISE